MNPQARQVWAEAHKIFSLMGEDLDTEKPFSRRISYRADFGHGAHE